MVVRQKGIGHFFKTEKSSDFNARNFQNLTLKIFIAKFLISDDWWGYQLLRGDVNI